MPRLLDTKTLEEINRAARVIEEGGIILYPTDTIWGIGCDATNEKAIERFKADFGGGVSVEFKCGYSDYVSRRCFAEIKRRFKKK